MESAQNAAGSIPNKAYYVNSFDNKNLKITNSTIF